MPSVMVTMKGRQSTNDRVIIGCHMDSTGAWSQAPGKFLYIN